MAERIHVTAPGGDYDIHIETGLLERVADFIPGGRTAIVTNTTLAKIYRKQLITVLPQAALVMMPDGEQYKTLETAAKLYGDFVEAGLDRGSTVVAFGGGVVGDTAGFAAGTYMRGVRFAQIPTSLLAMVDSSVGGKVGVDLPQGKNLIGVFKQPYVVLIDSNALRTLPEREWRCGMAEAIKHGFLADEGLLELIEAHFHEFTTSDIVDELIRRAVQVKVDVVRQDPFEQNIRAHLNLGHTFAHAIEQVSGYSWLHGEAVGVGLLAAARLSRTLGLCEDALVERVRNILDVVGLPMQIGNLDIEAIYAAMATDKKWQNGHSRFILLKGIGQPLIVEDVPVEKIMNVLSSLR